MSACEIQNWAREMERAQYVVTILMEILTPVLSFFPTPLQHPVLPSLRSAPSNPPDKRQLGEF